MEATRRSRVDIRRIISTGTASFAVSQETASRENDMYNHVRSMGRRNRNGRRTRTALEPRNRSVPQGLSLEPVGDTSWGGVYKVPGPTWSKHPSKKTLWANHDHLVHLKCSFVAFHLFLVSFV